MKTYAIYDNDLQRSEAVGFLFYYEKSNNFIIELCNDLSEWEAPLLFQNLVKNGTYTVSSKNAMLWVKERIIPVTRQNIGIILKNEKLTQYNEMTFLIRAKGKCCQDNCYIKEISSNNIPKDIAERQLKTIKECFVSEDKNIICMFRDGMIRKADLSTIPGKDISHIIKNNDLLNSIKVGAGGYCVTFNDSIEIEASLLRTSGQLIPLSYQDFYNFVEKNVVDTTSAKDMLKCSRQNMSYLIKHNMLVPIKRGSKENLFTTGAIYEVMHE